jgi:hypothetical protein
MVGVLFQIGIFPLVMIAVAPVFFPSAWHEHFWQWVMSPSKINQTQPFIRSQNKLLVPFLAAYFVVQMILPWRYLFYSGLNSTTMLWTEEGYRFGWRVMLMEKSGSATFYVKDRCTGREGIVDNGEFLKPQQEKQMAMQPDMILQYAHYLHDHYALQGLCDPAVRCEDYVTLNGRPGQSFIDPAVDLSRVRDGWGHKDWILPMKTRRCLP